MQGLSLVLCRLIFLGHDLVQSDSAEPDFLILFFIFCDLITFLWALHPFVVLHMKCSIVNPITAGGLRNRAEVPSPEQAAGARSSPVWLSDLSAHLPTGCEQFPGKTLCWFPCKVGKTHCLFLCTLFFLMYGLNKVERHMESGMEIGDAVPQGRQAGATTSGIPARRNLMHLKLHKVALPYITYLQMVSTCR